MKVMLFNTARIRVDENGLVCLNDIHRAAGFSANRRPSDWMSLATTIKTIPAMLTRITGKAGNWAKNEYRSVTYTKTGQAGGTWAHENLALSYAEYLSPKLGIEIREVFLRYKRGDESLVAEIRENKTRHEATDHELHRQVGKEVRKRYTKTLDEHGVKHWFEYAGCTNEVYKPLLGGTAKQIRKQRGLPPGANVRDSMSIGELAYTMASEALAAERIEHQNSMGFLQCKDATKQASTAIVSAIEGDRRNRQKSML